MNKSFTLPFLSPRRWVCMRAPPQRSHRLSWVCSSTWRQRVGRPPHSPPSASITPRDAASPQTTREPTFFSYINIFIHSRAIVDYVTVKQCKFLTNLLEVLMKGETFSLLRLFPLGKVDAVIRNKSLTTFVVNCNFVCNFVDVLLTPSPSQMKHIL